MKYNFQVPAIGVSTLGSFNLLSAKMGVPQFPSYLMSVLLDDAKPPLTFTQRLTNTFFDVIWTFYTDYFFYPWLVIYILVL